MFDGMLPESSTNIASTLVETVWNYVASDNVETTETLEYVHSRTMHKPSLGLLFQSYSPVPSFYDLISSGVGYFHYNGSLTTPPCTEGLDWFVMAESQSIPQSLVNAFWNHIGGYPGNARPVQDINDRTIVYALD